MQAMHIPDGFFDGPTSLAAGLIAVAGVAYCLRRTSQTLDERDIPVVGLVAAFVFAAQMLNFPVANGTSGHLMGGVLAAVLVGPYAGALAVTVVLVVQALLFADGGLSALGLNVVNMALVGTFAGYGIFLLARKLHHVGHAGRWHRRVHRAGAGGRRVHAGVRRRRQRCRLCRIAGDGDDRRAHA